MCLTPWWVLFSPLTCCASLLLQQLEHSPNPAYREAVSRILINDPHAQIEGLSLASSNDLLLSTIRKSTVCGLNFLRYLSGQDQMLKLYRLKVVDNKVSGQDSDGFKDDAALPPPVATGEEDVLDLP